jgi:hypothetical protein
MLALLGSLVLAQPVAAEAADGVAATQMDAMGLLSLKVKRSDKVMKHPGHILQSGEETTLVLKQGDRVHEVTVYVERVEGGFKFEVAYTDNGSLIISGEKVGKAKEWVKLTSGNGKSWVQLQLDPSKKRPDGVDMPDGNDPLDGL